MGVACVQWQLSLDMSGYEHVSTCPVTTTTRHKLHPKNILEG